MCGIVGFTGGHNASKVLLDGLKRLEYRGYDSAGIAVMNEGKISLAKVKGRIANLCDLTKDGETIPGGTGIGHTRWATHGAPTDNNAHPHISNDEKFAVVHNGIIENFQTLRDELIVKGYEFHSETDTEVIVHLLEMYYDGNFKKAVMKTVSRLEGSYAIGILCTDYPDTVYAVREASPLILGVGVEENFFASDVTALVSYTKNAIYLEDNEFAEITPNEIKVFDCMGKHIDKPINRITWNIEAAEKGGYEHFMLKEIMEQPAAVKATLAPRIKNDEIVLDDFELSKEYLEGVRKIVITACGSALYAGYAGSYALQGICRIPVEMVLASELRYSDPIIDESTLLIVLSQSGETADTIAAMKECKSRGAKSIAIVNVVGSTIAKLADHTIYTWAGPEIAVATTKGYTTQLSVLYLLSVYIGRKIGKINAAEEAMYVKELQALPRNIQQVIDINHSLEKLAQKYYKSRSLFFIGRNTDYAVAMEGALKMKEISYIHAEAYAAGELKHGTIALIDDGQPVIAVCCNEALIEKTTSNIIEVKARGAEVISVVFKDRTDMFAQADDVIPVPRVDKFFTPIVSVVPLQILAYYAAKANGRDIDKPRNLAKSVTVE